MIKKLSQKSRKAASAKDKTHSMQCTATEQARAHSSAPGSVRSWMPMVYRLPSMCASDSEDTDDEECALDTGSTAPRREEQLVAEERRLEAVLASRRELRGSIVAEACTDEASAAGGAAAAAELDVGIKITSGRVARVRDELKKLRATRLGASSFQSIDVSSAPKAVEALYLLEEEADYAVGINSSTPSASKAAKECWEHAPSEQQRKALSSLHRFEQTWLLR